VRQAAREALNEILGSERARIAIAAYRIEGNEGSWILADDPGEDDSPEDPQEWDEEELRGLLLVMSAGGDPKVRVRAIRRLEQINDMRAISTIAMAALRADDEAVSDAAYAAMKELFGDESKKILQSYRDYGFWAPDGTVDLEPEEEFAEDDDEAGADNDDFEADETPSWGDSTAQMTRASGWNSPVMQEEKAGWLTAVLIGAGILILLGAIFYFFLR
jgi:hypothetical protein